MHRRNVRFAALLTIIVMVGAFAWACGGDDTSMPAATPHIPQVDTQVNTGPPATDDPTRHAAGTHPLIGERIVPVPTDTLPAEFTDALEEKPIVLFFYVPGGFDDERVYESLQTLRGSFGRYEFLTYEYSSSDLYEDLSTLLDVGYPPHLVLIDETGTVADVWNGYVDQGSLNQSLVNLRTNSR
jgi:hypothetical protein